MEQLSDNRGEEILRCGKKSTGGSLMICSAAPAKVHFASGLTKIKLGWKALSFWYSAQDVQFAGSKVLVTSCKTTYTRFITALEVVSSAGSR